MVNYEVINLTIIRKFRTFKPEFYGLRKKMNYAQKNGYKFNEIMNLTIKIDSNPSSINIHYYLKCRYR